MASTDLIAVEQNVTAQTLLPAHCRNPYESGVLHYLVTHISLSVAILGIPANILALFVLNYRVTGRSPTHILLTALAVVDILIIISYSAYYIAVHYYETYNIVWLGYLRYIDTPLFYMVNWTKMVEIYTVVLLSLERYVAIRWPLKATRLCSVGRTKRGLHVIVILSGIFKLPNLIFDYRTLKWDVQCQSYRLEPIFSSASWYPTFKLVYVQLLDQVCSFVIPLSLLIFLNFGLISRIRRFTKHHMHGRWTGGKAVSTEASGDSDVFYSDTSPTKSNTPSYSYKASVIRNLSFHASFRLRRSHPVKPSSGSQGEEALTRTTVFSEGTGTGDVASETRQRGVNSNNRGILLTLIGVVTIFILCESPTTVCFLFEMVNLIYRLCRKDEGGDDDVGKSVIFVTSDHLSYYAYPAALVLVLVGCASNFFIYILIGKRFRRNCNQLLVSLANKLCCWSGRAKEETDLGFLHPLKHLPRNKMMRSGLMTPHGQMSRVEKRGRRRSRRKSTNSGASTVIPSQQTPHPQPLL